MTENGQNRRGRQHRRLEGEESPLEFLDSRLGDHRARVYICQSSTEDGVNISFEESLDEIREDTSSTFWEILNEEGGGKLYLGDRTISIEFEEEEPEDYELRETPYDLEVMLPETGETDYEVPREGGDNPSINYL